MIKNALSRILSFIRENDETGVSTQDISEYLERTGPKEETFSRKGLVHHLRQLEIRGEIVERDESEQFEDPYGHWHWHISNQDK